MTAEKQKAIENKYAEAYIATYKSIPEEYHYFIVDLEQRKNIGTKQNECWITVTTPYFPVSGRQKWAENEHNEAGKQFVILGQTNTSDEPKIVTMSVPLWAMPGAAASFIDAKNNLISDAPLNMQVLIPAHSHYSLFASHCVQSLAVEFLLIFLA